MKQKVLTTYTIAAYCQVTPRTVIQWINEGKLAAYRTPGNHSRVKVEAFLDFLKKYNMPVPADLAAYEKDRKKRVLIVDDDEGMVFSIEHMLKLDHAYAIEKAYDGFEAGAKFSAFKPDLIILDVRMPGVDGYKLCSHIRSNPENKNVKIILMSGAVDQELKEKALGLGANDYLAKPFDGAALKQKVEGLL